MKGNVSIPTTTLGFVADKTTLALAYSASDLFVLPSRSEPFGQVLLESIACGAPGIAFAVGGVPDVIRHGETGLLATPEHPEELAAGITGLLGDQGRRAEMAHRCRKVAVEHFSTEAQARSHLDIYGALQQGEL